MNLFLEVGYINKSLPILRHAFSVLLTKPNCTAAGTWKILAQMYLDLSDSYFPNNLMLSFVWFLCPPQHRSISQILDKT